ncbi:VOC family protein [Natrarchaeobius oligotrophus]|uniref:VOC family protein n=1 Tax=Natrarchaeobius chitinivorans TaxID=1679083 RepID=A0A3N6MCV5_NATCH|nr:VOC family protein [Natrarchaeobius chitinivorans]RQH00538.1 VOC family protein [Natrarchaeobius chitinivorans]
MTGPSPQTHHVGITVSDLESTLSFYRDVLGFDVVDRFSVAGKALSEGIGVENASGTFVHLESGGVRLELVRFEPEANESRESALNRPGTTHVALAVDDLESFYATLPDDVETISEPRTTESGTTILFVRDPEDNLVELLES